MLFMPVMYISARSKPRPKPFDFLNEKMDLMIEQTGKFVQHGREINTTLRKMPKAIAAEIGAMRN